jgi:predicted esterase
MLVAIMIVYVCIKYGQKYKCFVHFQPMFFFESILTLSQWSHYKNEIVTKRAVFEFKNKE